MKKKNWIKFLNFLYVVSMLEELTEMGLGYSLSGELWNFVK